MTTLNPSPTCLVNGFSTANGVDVTKNTTITIQLEDVSGVNTWEITCIGTDDILTTDDINDTLTITDPVNKTATFDMPNADGYSAIFRSVVNQGRDINGRGVASYTTTFKIATLVNGNRTLAVNETVEDNASYGWTSRINKVIRNPLYADPPNLSMNWDGDESVAAHGTGSAATITDDDEMTSYGPDGIVGFITITINGVPRKIPYYNP